MCLIFGVMFGDLMVGFNSLRSLVGCPFIGGWDWLLVAFCVVVGC